MRQVRYWLSFSVRERVAKLEENVKCKCARVLPNWLKYWVVITTAADYSVNHPTQTIPEITWDMIVEELK